MRKEDLELATCTDVKQKWGKLRSDAKAMYQAVPVDTMCHGLEKFPDYKVPLVSENEKLWSLELVCQRTLKSFSNFHLKIDPNYDQSHSCFQAPLLVNWVKPN